MAITSQITMRPITGQDPVGYIPFPMPAAGPIENYISPNIYKFEQSEALFFIITVDPEANKLAFLNATKTYLDTHYAQSNFGTLTSDVFLDYTVSKVERTYNALSNSIWEARSYVWKVSVYIRANTNY